MTSQHPANSLPRGFRLKGRAIIERLFDRSDDANRTVAHGAVRIIYRRDVVLHQVAFQIAFAVGRKTGKAVDRNRIKRQMREAVRHRAIALRGVLDDAGSSVAIVMLYRGDADRPNREIRSDAAAALRKLENRLSATPETA